MALKWESQGSAYGEAIQYMNYRKEGIITSFQTPWLSFNKAGTGGLEWQSTIIIGGRPGHGKTLVKDQIIREGWKLNSNSPFRVLEFSLEMNPKTVALREFSANLKEDYNNLLSVPSPVSDEILDKCQVYSDEHKTYPRDIVKDAPTITQFKKIVEDYMKTYGKKNEDGTIDYVNTIITIDHSILMKRDKGEKDSLTMLYNLGEALTHLKRIYPIIFIVLNQLNRSIDDPKRNEDGKHGNLVNTADFFGSDAMLMHADLLCAIDVPKKRHLKLYGPDKFIIVDDTVVTINFLKCRNGSTGMCFFKAYWNAFTLLETPPPNRDNKVKTAYSYPPPDQIDY